MPGRAGRNRNRDPHHYWNHTASTKPEAQALATRLGLDLPTNQADGCQSGLVYPIRRLIIAGEDNPANLTTLLGPLWETKAGQIVKQTRIEVLLCPPPGSPSHMVSQQYDAGSPRWAPRAPNEEEEIELGRVRDMKQRLAVQLGGRKNAETKDIKDILLEMGGNWTENLGVLQAAMNATD